MSNGRYSLPSGREVFLTSLYLDGTYSGALEGSPETLTPHILRELRARTCAPRRGKPLVLQEPGVVPLPEFRLWAELESRQGVKQEGAEFHSELALCFFAAQIDVSIDKLLEAALEKLDWDAHAKDFDILP